MYGATFCIRRKQIYRIHIIFLIIWKGIGKEGERERKRRKEGKEKRKGEGRSEKEKRKTNELKN